MGKKDPSPPDVRGAAETEGRYSREIARDATYADRPNQYGPLGSVEWGQTLGSDPASESRLRGAVEEARRNVERYSSSTPASNSAYPPGYAPAHPPGYGPLNLVPYANSNIQGDTGRLAEAESALSEAERAFSAANVTKWTQTQTLTPDLQSTLDSTLGMMKGRAGLAESLNPRIEREMGSDPDWAQFGDVVGFDPTEQRASAEEASYQKSANRLDPRFARQRESLDIRLRNQGLVPGDQAYDAQIENFGTERTDAYEQARLGSVAAGRDEFGVALQGNERANALRDQQIAEYLAKRGFSLGEQKRLTEGQSLTDLAGVTSGG